MPRVRDITTCSTSAVRGLDQQLIAGMNQVISNVLVDCSDLNIATTGSSVWPFLQPAAKQALQRALESRDRRMLINSAYRTIAAQLVLYQHYQAGRCGISLAARPGRSNHQSGLAIDIEDVSGWRPFLERQGWRWLGSSDPVHFDFIGTGVRDIRETAVLAFQRLWNLNNPQDRIAEDGDYGPNTELRLGNAPAEGFPRGNRISVSPPSSSGSTARTLALTHPPLEGEDVRQVQTALTQAGFPLVADGVFGPATQMAVQRFQGVQGLAIDGIVGPTTLDALKRATTPRPTPSPTPNPTPNPTPIPSPAPSFPTHAVQINGQLQTGQGIVIDGNSYIPIALLEPLGVDLLIHEGSSYIRAVDLRDLALQVRWDGATRTLILTS